MANIKRLVREAKRTRKNRAYYEQYWNVEDIRRAGLVQDEQRTQLERVQVGENSNELILFFGFDQGQRESHFKLQLSIVSLFPNGPGAPESRWRLASLDFKLVLVGSDEPTTYTYTMEQLIDYQEKRSEQAAGKHEHRNIYKVGSMSVEQVLPFSFARILFNGPMRVTRADGSSRLEPLRLAISTHPTCDKFDYAFRFDVEHTASVLARSLKPADEKRQLLGQVLENRLDQPLMFQGQIESLVNRNASERSKPDEHFIFWGAKVKRMLDLCADQLSSAEDEDERDCLFAWTEFGQQVHLSRPVRRPNLVYGLVHNSYDYASCLYEARLFKAEAGEEKEVDFSELDSFSELAGSLRIKLRAFQKKWYTLEIGQNDFRPTSETPVFRIKLNGFEGLAMRLNLGLVGRLRAAQSKLLALTIDDGAFAFLLAEERLLGGKGDSLVRLAQLVDRKQLASTTFNGNAADRVQVSVPRGLVVSTRAYSLWLASSPKIANALRELDETRRSLAAKSIHLNPMSKEYLSLSSGQKILRDKCERTQAELKSAPLPLLLKNHIYQELVRCFGSSELQDGAEKLFAVRSSAVGEDSLESSAAGQMKTILDARGFASVCQAIVDCWASQFDLEALTYKSQNGLTFNLPMAVVVQELIGCHAAGVAATCDPLTGNRERLEITANFGLGEGVVSGKKTDTVRLSLEQPEQSEQFGRHELDEDRAQPLSLPKHAGAIEKLTEGDCAECCLTDEQIVALSNLLLELRHASPIKEREVEWGLTLTSEGARFRLHLLQSRPLTHLQRLDTREIDHELDYGLPCARDLVSRANLGEVMPGALCPLASSYMMPVTSSYATQKPFELEHTRKTYVADTFAFHSQMIMMIYTYSDTIKRFSGIDENSRDTARATIYSMIGTVYEEPETEEGREQMFRFQAEKVNPLATESKHGLLNLLALDSGWYKLMAGNIRRQIRRTILNDDLPAPDELAGRQTASDSAGLGLRRQIELLYGRILTSTQSLCLSWFAHIEATVLSMGLNVICLKMLNAQPAYANSDDIVATEILNDFSVLMRKPKPLAAGDRLDKQTESGDISKLLNLLLKCVVEENLLDRLKALKPRELHDFFSGEQFKCCQLFRDFMRRNGHRAFREFCFSTITWGDDPSYIMRLLAMRLRNHTHEEAEREERKRADMEREHAQRFAQVEAKISSNKFALMKWAFPRARNATIRREGSKSLLIKTIHKFRLAFRHLGGLLCLAGLLPSADLIFYLTIEEIDDLINCYCRDSRHSQNSLMPRLLYKARRRQQRARAYDSVKFPKPTLVVNEMLQTIREQILPPPIDQHPEARAQTPSKNGLIPGNTDRVQVKGLVSCAGLVTGRACVILSLDDVDQIEPGDILITYSIDISWSVYFFALAGIVTELGGIVSHGAVVAREYGIPTLCTALSACSKFKTGQMVTLDATRGVCFLAAEAASQQQISDADGNMMEKAAGDFQ